MPALHFEALRWNHPIWTRPWPNRGTQIASGAEISRLIKTLTSDNVRDMARKLGKSSHSHPLLFAEKVLNQLERCGWQQRRRSEAVG